MALAACTWFVMLYTYQGLRFLLLLLFCIPVISLILFLPQKRRTKVDISGIPDYVTRGETVRLRVKVAEKSVLPLAGVEIKGTWKAYGEKKLRFRKMLAGMRGGTERDIELELPAEHCGPAGFTLARARIYDCLRLFSFSVSGKKRKEILITPRLEPLSENEAETVMGLLLRPGVSDEGEPFVRDYHPGDSPRSIHWKLTVKADDVQVRDREPDRQVSLFLNLTDRVWEDQARRDVLLDRACSLMAFFAEACGDRTEICWVQGRALCRNQIREPGDIYPCIHKLAALKRPGQETLNEQDRHSMLAGFHLEEDGRLYLGERCIDEK